jgi:hypothetical protein
MLTSPGNILFVPVRCFHYPAHRISLFRPPFSGVVVCGITFDLTVLRHALVDNLKSGRVRTPESQPNAWSGALRAQVKPRPKPSRLSPHIQIQTPLSGASRFGKPVG